MEMICRLCLSTLDAKNAVLLFDPADKTIPESYFVQLISTHLYLCLSRDDAISTAICADCSAQLESFHNFWKLVELKQTTLCSQFLEIDCDVNWSEEGDAEQLATAIIKYEPEAYQDAEVGGNETPPTVYDIVKEEPEFHDSYVKIDSKTAATHKFPCMFCEKSFKMRRYLEEHVATHTGDRPISCAYCNMAFRCRSNMYTHVKTKHTTQWQKARAERESAKSNSNNNNQVQRSVNGNNTVVDVITLLPSEMDGIRNQNEANQQTAAAPATTVVPEISLIAIKSDPPMQVINTDPPMKALKPDPPMEAINLTVNKSQNHVAPPKRFTRSSRRKTHSPKKVQPTERSASESSSSNDNDNMADLHEKRLKTQLQTSKENELLLANYNAMAAVVAAATQQQHQRYCNSMQEQLLTAMAAVSASTGTSTSTAAAAAAATAAAIALSKQTAAAAAAAAASSTSTTSTAPVESAYSCSICGQQLRNQRALNNHLQNKHNSPSQQATSTLTESLAMTLCNTCGELLGQQQHRCLGKTKYACDICGKSFKMKRYLEEHFATHTGVKLHTCSFCPTEFRSKSNMYHHTKRKHKIEWERSRATRNAAKSAVSELQQHQQQQLEEPGSSS
ncbi:CG12219 [Drosophila busckii]|uniref:CG12219 n=1 Tax=Drosophila busckii TaxID=30019 RepID=A0A0M4EV35_DROBS|nr:zinc finger protein 40 [Drosophila busckii]ALC49060.1 CG12219 [Drosophila busckii]